MFCSLTGAEETVFIVEGMSGVDRSADGGDSFSSKVINIVFVILLLDLLGFTLILPLLPSILDHYAQTEVSECFVVFYKNVLILVFNYNQSSYLPVSRRKWVLTGSHWKENNKEACAGGICSRKKPN